jgi:hypothetical protein
MIQRFIPIQRTPLSNISAKAKREAKSPVVVKVMAGGLEVCQRNPMGLAEYKRRTLEMAERQGGRCAICGFTFDGWLGQPTFDHEAGRCVGKRDDRIEINGEWRNAALHQACNGHKGSKSYSWASGLYLPVKKEDK